MQDYTVHRCTKRCRKSSRALAPGEWYYSVVERKHVNFVRYDIALSQWNGPPPHAIAWWKSQMPESKQAAYTPTPNSLLLERLRELSDDPAQQPLAYLLAMLLVRRKVLEYASNSPLSSEQQTASAAESLILKSVADGTVYCVDELSESLNEEQIASYQQVLQEELVVQAIESSDRSDTDDSPAEDLELAQPNPDYVDSPKDSVS
jgi:hypothetical protein